MGMKETYEEKVATRLDKLNEQIAELAAKADEATGQAKAKYEQQVEKLREHRDAVQQKSEQVQAAGEVAWRDLQSGMNEALDELKGAIAAAQSRFEQS
jgi:dsDNA-specific endonuclease/ATPase MutS2